MLPEEFQNRMRAILGTEAEQLLAALEQPESVHALRVNTSKIGTERFLSLFPFDCRPIPYAKDGFYVSSAKLGNTPYHHAGMIYLQDPAAMSTLHSLRPGKGWRVLDTCAAPGGKSSQASAYVGDGGVVVSNEYVAARGRILAGNLERLGCRNTIVTNVDTAVLGEWYPAYFDLVIADVPCSGEGMFRKNPEAISEWSPQNVSACAVRQREILENIAGCVRPGGYLLYSTCTFSLEENEENVAWFLKEYPEYALVPVAEELCAYTADGVMLPDVPYDLTLTRRFYPHRCPGEGQYMALFRRQDTGGETCPDDRQDDRQDDRHSSPHSDRRNRCDQSSPEAPAFRETAKPLSREEQRVIDAFLNAYLVKMPEVRFCKYRDTVYAVPAGEAVPPFGVISAGAAVGETVKGRLNPAHHLFMAFGNLFRQILDLPAEDPRVAAYLHGDVIPAPGIPDGWAVLTVEGCTLGGIKVVGGMAKNHYPKGLRIP